MVRQRVIVTVIVLLITGVSVLVPATPLSAFTCFADNGGLVYAVAIAGGAEGFFSLVGEVVFSPTLSFPLTGSAHIRSDGRAHVAMVVHSALPGVLAPFVLQAFLNPPTFSVGNGTFANFAGGQGNLAFNATACPAVFPQ